MLEYRTNYMTMKKTSAITYTVEKEDLPPAQRLQFYEFRRDVTNGIKQELFGIMKDVYGWPDAVPATGVERDVSEDAEYTLSERKEPLAIEERKPRPGVRVLGRIKAPSDEAPEHEKDGEIEQPQKEAPVPHY